MTANLNTSILNLQVDDAPLSCSVLSSILYDKSLEPLEESKYGPDLYPKYYEDWNHNAFKSDNYNFNYEDSEKINTIITFAKNLLENSKNIESDFVDIVNDNFWDLI